MNSKLELGSHSQIVCRADGRSLPKVKWFKEGATGLPDQVDDLDGLLVFLDVRHSDAGRYTCIASNDQGLINITIAVDVIGETALQRLLVYSSAPECHILLISI